MDNLLHHSCLPVRQISVDFVSVPMLVLLLFVSSSHEGVPGGKHMELQI